MLVAIRPVGESEEEDGDRGLSEKRGEAGGGWIEDVDAREGVVRVEVGEGVRGVCSWDGGCDFCDWRLFEALEYLDGCG